MDQGLSNKHGINCFASIIDEQIAFKFTKTWTQLLTKSVNKQCKLINEVHAQVRQVIWFHTRICSLAIFETSFTSSFSCFLKISWMNFSNSQVWINKTSLYIKITEVSKVLWEEEGLTASNQYSVNCIKHLNVEQIFTSAALSKKNEATNKFFWPSPPPPFHMPPNVHFMWVHDSLTFRALIAASLHLLRLEPDGKAEALNTAWPYLYEPKNKQYIITIFSTKKKKEILPLLFVLIHSYRVKVRLIPWIVFILLTILAS